MNHVTTHSESEHRRLVDEFLATVFDDLAATHAGVRRSMTPDLPDDPSPEQVRAWTELAELALDPDFRATMRQMAQCHATETEQAGLVPPRRDIAAFVRDLADEAVAAPIDPASTDADPTVAAIAAHYAARLDTPDGPGVRGRLLARLATISDPRRDRYAELLAMVNGWPAPQQLKPALDWAIQALQARPQGRDHER
ncbi:hypothetical protein SAMN05421678_1124 [Actinopolymorpha cephalotaxi]|uniref:Uncharacterized protein n=1 Tax=Actinopolymorpha cephalotaxi TaxID=504797 RepID=A0A1I2X5B9_9ACTN|nr:hypothetical protein [Actinopolymorpha cephalotaxi]NYH86067.1 hypothetical protein [Actinopolymorpha cephalotaxi]SFH08612.1 hypothetical protein SAMN05421678_1124 [Actinopolymorpha cephalotaxi]